MAQQSQTTKVVLVVVLAVVLAVVLLVQLGIVPLGSARRGSPAPAPAGKSGAPAAGAAQSPPAKAPAATSTAAKAGPGWKRPDAVGPVVRDPTVLDAAQQAARTKEAAAVSTEPEYLVAGVVFNPEQLSSVIVDGHVLHEGDTIQGAVIVRIREGEAELRRDGKTWIVKPGRRYRGSELVPPGN
jgi:hypothetical protein